MDFNVQTRVTQVQRFFSRDLWLINLAELPAPRRRSFTFLRVVMIVIKGYIKDNCSLQAAALTYITLMSMVPVLALTFSVAKGLGAQQALQDIVDRNFSDMPPQLGDAVTKIFELVNKTSFAALGVVGVALLFFTVIKVMGTIEGTFNTIWGVREGRTWLRRFADYISVLTIVPVLILVVSAMNGALANRDVQHSISTLLGVESVYLLILYNVGLQIFGAAGICAAFIFLYSFMPNTKVQFKAALVGGICGGLLWLLWQWLCINFQVLLTRYNPIYGGFATIPIGLFWLWLNWNIVLFGAEICFAFQNYQTYTLEGLADESSYATRKDLAYIIMFEISRSFRQGSGAWTPDHIQTGSHVPIRLLRSVLFDLHTAKLVMPVEKGGYLPARDPATITCRDVEQSLIGEADPRVRSLAQRSGSGMLATLGNFRQAYLERLAGTNFSDLVAAAGPEQPADPNERLTADLAATAKPVPAPPGVAKQG